MKKYLFCLFFLIGMQNVKAQKTAVAAAVADKIARKMADTLNLTNQQKQQVYDINLRLHDRKMAMRQLHSNNPSLEMYLQRIENTRDSLYQTVLSEEKYLRYRQKKPNLVNNN
ncbi:MAG TPA: hypothetical protein VJU78_19865 [Chitinophagaceae bacterium]|nr:hypothetical protein [Chitinophagaceae bacterium]